MKEKGKVLRIYVSNTDRIDGRPLYRELVMEAKRFGLAGATVLKGVMGYGLSSTTVADSFWEFTDKLPVVVEIVDTASRIDAFAESIRPRLEATPKGLLMIAQDVEILIEKKGSI